MLSYKLEGRFAPVAGEGYKFTADDPADFESKLIEAQFQDYFDDKTTRNLIITTTSHYQGSEYLLYTLQNLERNVYGEMLITDYRYVAFKTSYFEDPLQSILIIGYTALIGLADFYWFLRFLVSVSVR